jgi:hypothetical protein
MEARRFFPGGGGGGGADPGQGIPRRISIRIVGIAESGSRYSTEDYGTRKILKTKKDQF